jgi:arylsulfatase A-like enzyme
MDALAHMTAVRRLPPHLVDPLDEAYDGSVHAQDRATGAILDLLRERGILDRALVVVAGDHGENLGEDGDLEHAFSVADTLLRVPLLMRWPGRIPAGSVEDALVRLQDLYPTILAAAGVAIPAGNGVDAEPLLPLPAAPRVAVAEWGPGSDILDRLRKENPGARIPGEDRCREALLAVVDPAGLKYVRTTAIAADGSTAIREALHDLRADPGEDRDLLGGTPAPVHRAAADALRAHGLAEFPPARR